jgi:hypothetical protein
MITPRAANLALVQEIADRHHTTPAELVGRHKRRRLLAARIELAKALEARGYKAPQIAAVLHRNYTTVYFYLGRCANKQPRVRPPRPAPVKKTKPEPPRPREPVRYAGWDRHERRDYFATNNPQPGGESQDKSNLKIG